MKKTFSIVILFVALMSVFNGCGNSLSGTKWLYRDGTLAYWLTFESSDEYEITIYSVIGTEVKLVPGRGSRGTYKISDDSKSVIITTDKGERLTFIFDGDNILVNESSGIRFEKS